MRNPDTAMMRSPLTALVLLLILIGCCWWLLKVTP